MRRAWRGTACADTGRRVRVQVHCCDQNSVLLPEYFCYRFRVKTNVCAEQRGALSSVLSPVNGEWLKGLMLSDSAGNSTQTRWAPQLTVSRSETLRYFQTKNSRNISSLLKMNCKPKKPPTIVTPKGTVAFSEAKCANEMRTRRKRDTNRENGNELWVHSEFSVVRKQRLYWNHKRPFQKSKTFKYVVSNCSKSSHL